MSTPKKPHEIQDLRRFDAALVGGARWTAAALLASGSPHRCQDHLSRRVLRLMKIWQTIQVFALRPTIPQRVYSPLAFRNDAAHYRPAGCPVGGLPVASGPVSEPDRVVASRQTRAGGRTPSVSVERRRGRGDLSSSRTGRTAVTRALVPRSGARGG